MEMIHCDKACYVTALATVCLAKENYTHTIVLFILYNVFQELLFILTNLTCQECYIQLFPSSATPTSPPVGVVSVSGMAGRG